MTSIAQPVQAEAYTPEEVERLSDTHQKLYELVDGVLTEKPAMSMKSNRVAVRLSRFLQNTYPEERAQVFVEQPTYCFGSPKKMRRPDLALVWTERVPGGVTDEELFVAPDFVVEVVSPSNTYNELLARVDEYLAAGVPLVWLADPVGRRIQVYRGDGSIALLRAADTLKDEPLLPGLALPIADCFPAVPESAKVSS